MLAGAGDMIKWRCRARNGTVAGESQQKSSRNFSILPLKLRRQAKTSSPLDVDSVFLCGDHGFVAVSLTLKCNKFRRLTTCFNSNQSESSLPREKASLTINLIHYGIAASGGSDFMREE